MSLRAVFIATVILAALFLKPSGDIVGTEEAAAVLFAHRSVGTACACNIRGNRANIRANAALLSGSANFMLVRVFIQSSFSGDPGLVQIGLIRGGSGWTHPTCGNLAISNPRVQWEWKAPGNPTFNCGWGIALTSYPDTSRYSVARSGEQTSWSMFFRGALQHEVVNFGFDIGVLGAGHEIIQNSAANDADTDYGVGDTPWQRTSNTNTPWTWTTIQTANNVNDSVFWSMSTPTNPASPFLLDYHNP